MKSLRALICALVNCESRRISKIWGEKNIPGFADESGAIYFITVDRNVSNRQKIH